MSMSSKQLSYSWGCSEVVPCTVAFVFASFITSEWSCDVHTSWLQSSFWSGPRSCQISTEWLCFLSLIGRGHGSEVKHHHGYAAATRGQAGGILTLTDSASGTGNHFASRCLKTQLSAQLRAADSASRQHCVIFCLRCFNFSHIARDDFGYCIEASKVVHKTDTQPWGASYALRKCMKLETSHQWVCLLDINVPLILAYGFHQFS